MDGGGTDKGVADGEAVRGGVRGVRGEGVDFFGGEGLEVGDFVVYSRR